MGDFIAGGMCEVPKNCFRVDLTTLYLFPFNLINVGGGRNHHPLSENHNFSQTALPVDLGPVCKLEFVRCGQIENKHN